MQVSSTIFKAYDIRGVVPETLNPTVVAALGRAFGTVAMRKGQHTVAVGRDGRLSGPELAAALIEGLCQAGVQVLDIGMVTTPMLYFAAHTLCESGIQLTGSHNPKDYNGLKMVMDRKALHGAEIQALRAMVEAETWESIPGGSVRQVDVAQAYRDRIVGDIRLSRSMKVVVDCGNGVAGVCAPALLRAIGCEVVPLFAEIDGCFPNHHPDPSKPENLRDLVAALRSGDAEVGLAFDGDGDRLGVVTRDGETIYPDRQMMLFAADVLERVPGATIVYDVKCSQRLAPSIATAGGHPMMCRTGHSLVKARMLEVDSPLAGEMSGHIFFRERWYGFDDGVYAACRLLEILSRHANATEALHRLPTSCSTPELNVPCVEGEPHRVVEELLAKVSVPAPARVDTTDGLRVDWPDGFGLIRASNTTPVLVLRFEGHTPDSMERIQSTMMDWLRSVKPDAAIAADGVAH